jgi:uncharacterized membrane protein YciS (DUF1049 family)
VLDLESVMIIIVGLIIVIAAVIIGVAGVLGNGGQAHTLAHGFAVFGYHVTGHTGTLFLAGMIVGAAAVLGLSLLLAGARRTSRRGSAARRGLKQSRQETAAVRQDRDDLIGQRDAARAYTASSIGNGTGLANGTAAADPPGPDDSGPGPNGTPPDAAEGSRWNRLRPLGRRATSRQAASEVSSDGEAADEAREPQGDGPPADVPAGAPAE